MCSFKNVLTFFDIVTSQMNTAGSRSYSTSSKVVLQSQIVSSNPNAVTLLGVVIEGSSWRNVSENIIYIPAYFKKIINV